MVIGAVFFNPQTGEIGASILYRYPLTNAMNTEGCS
ncbi:hypothetical protein [Escherichia coli]